MLCQVLDLSGNTCHSVGCLQPALPCLRIGPAVLTGKGNRTLDIWQDRTETGAVAKCFEDYFAFELQPKSCTYIQGLILKTLSKHEFKMRNP